jgi:hypothetical protein
MLASLGIEVFNLWLRHGEALEAMSASNPFSGLKLLGVDWFHDQRAVGTFDFTHN